MDGLAQVLDALLKQGILPAAFIIGSIAFFIALIGKIPTGNGHDIPLISRLLLGFFGLIFALAGLGGALFGVFAVINNSTSESAGNILVATSVVQAANVVEAPVVSVDPTLVSNEILQSLRPHISASLGTGIFEQVSYSDGMAQFTDTELSTNYFRIQRIRREENPTGCATARFDVSQVWFGASVGTELTKNGVSVGKLDVATGRHGYILNLSVVTGDELCAVGYDSGGFHIVFGPHIYYHYDSYCFRNYC